jgi:hypothetical protein
VAEAIRRGYRVSARLYTMHINNPDSHARQVHPTK